MPPFSDLNKFQAPKDPYLSQDHIPWPVEQNRVHTVEYNTRLVLRQITRSLPSSSREDQLSAITIRFHEAISAHPNARCPTFQVFESGRVVAMGATSEDKTRLYVHVLRFILLNIGYKARNSRILLRNKVSSGYYQHGLDTKNFEKDSDGMISTVVDDKTFPGTMWVYKPPGFNKTFRFTLFPAGKFIVMGMTGQDAREAFLHALPIFHRNRSPNGPARSRAGIGLNIVKTQLRKRPIDQISDQKTQNAHLGDMVRQTIEIADRQR